MRYELSDYEWTAIKPMLPNNSTETKSQRPDLLQPVSVSHAELDRTVLQQDQAMSARRHSI